MLTEAESAATTLQVENYSRNSWLAEISEGAMLAIHRLLLLLTHIYILRCYAGWTGNSARGIALVATEVGFIRY